MSVLLTTYKGYDMIVLASETKYKVKFGRRKAEKILNDLPRIRAHVMMYENADLNDRPSYIVDEETEYPIELSYYKCEKVIEYQSELRKFIE